MLYLSRYVTLKSWSLRKPGSEPNSCWGKIASKLLREYVPEVRRNSLQSTLVFYNFPRIYFVTRPCFTVNVERRGTLFDFTLFQIPRSFAERREKKMSREGRIFSTLRETTIEMHKRWQGNRGYEDSFLYRDVNFNVPLSTYVWEQTFFDFSFAWF